VPFTIHRRVAPNGAGVRANPANGATTTIAGAGSETVRSGPLTTRLERRVRLRTRRRADDEFRRAFRAELVSDDARYVLLFGLTAAWYSPVVLVFVAWVLLGNDETSLAARMLSGLLWLAGAALLSLAVVGLLRWAKIGWRTLTLSAAAALIGGGLATVAHTLAG
jgi:hypothetical protein